MPPISSPARMTSVSRACYSMGPGNYGFESKMEVAQPYTAADIPAWEGRLETAVSAYKANLDAWTAAGQGPSPDNHEMRLARLTLNMLKAGLDVSHQAGNLVLNGQVVLAVDGRRWRRRGQDGWNVSESLDEVVKATTTGSPAIAGDLVAPMRKTVARYEALRRSLGLERSPHSLPADPVEAWEHVQALAEEYERTRAEGTLGATSRQVRYATDIAKLLGIELPENLNRATAKSFITAHVEAFDAKREETKAAAGKPKADAQPATGKVKLKRKERQVAAAFPPAVAPVEVTPKQRVVPDYSRLRPVKVPLPVLAKLGVETVFELVERVNELRAEKRHACVSTREFPKTMGGFSRLAGEVRSAMAAAKAATEQASAPETSPAATVAPSASVPLPPQVQVPVAEPEPVVPPAVPPAPVAERLMEPMVATESRAVAEHPYDPEIPLIEFMADNLGLLTERQGLALNRRFYVTGVWKGFDALAQELGGSEQQAMTILDRAWDSFGSATGCWSAIRDAVLGAGRSAPATLADLGDQSWDAGLPEDAVLLVLEKAVGLRPVEIEGFGQFLVKLDRREAVRLGKTLQHYVPKITNLSEGAEMLPMLQKRFDGRADEALQRIVEKAILDAYGTLDVPVADLLKQYQTDPSAWKFRH